MKPKSLMHGLAVLLLIATPILSLAQQKTSSIEYVGKSTKFAMLVSDIPHFEGAIRTAEELGVSKTHFSFEIVLVGPLVKSIAEDKSLMPDIDKATDLGIKLVMCEHAMAHFGVEKGQLDKRIATTPNAAIYMFELQDRGYNTLAR